MNIFHAHYEFLKTEAELLLKNVQHMEPHAIARFQHLPVFSTLTRNDAQKPADLQLKHALQVIAVENDYPSWSDLKAALDTAAETSPLAEVQEQFYPKGFTTYWNIWFAKYSQARKVLDEGKGYLLPYKHQYFIVEEHFVDSIGIPHTLPEWKQIGNDWVHPRSVKAWLKLNALYADVLKNR
jgi:hypothetical protein